MRPAFKGRRFPFRTVRISRVCARLESQNLEHDARSFCCWGIESERSRPFRGGKKKISEIRGISPTREITHIDRSILVAQRQQPGRATPSINIPTLCEQKAALPSWTLSFRWSHPFSFFFEFFTTWWICEKERDEGRFLRVILWFINAFGLSIRAALS